MELITTKSILTNTKTRDWFGTDYAMNLYKGCHHGCIYCDSRSLCYGIENFDVVKGKKDAIQLLSRELQQKRFKGVIGTGSMSDPYNYEEKRSFFTQKSLELIHQFGFGLSIITKSDLVLRDSFMIKNIMQHSPVNIGLSLSTTDDKVARRIERNVALPTKRLEAVKELADQGIYTGIVLMPIIPYITDSWESIEQVVIKSKEAGAKYIYPFFGMTLRDIQKKYYFEFLHKEAPHILRRYESNHTGNYFYPIQNYWEIKTKFENLCKKMDITYKMEQIVKNYQKKYEVEQISLF